MLPIYDHFDEIADLLSSHSVILVAGETGSGKSTQLPQLCLKLMPEARIGHTQPRRIAAKAVAARVAEELKTPLGHIVGYQVRFDEALSAKTRIKVMTDGILLAETEGDPLLKRYDVLIIDEAHERSLNIDFILGYLKQLLPKRPDLKVIITSATLDHERLATHFGAPIVEVAGRTYPIDIRYAPLPGKEKQNALYQAILANLVKLQNEARGDTLIFLPTERDIREMRKRLSERFPHHEVLALYARLPLSTQQKVFHPGQAPRIILATNVAETSLTVPRIRYVIDSGLARVSRFHSALKIQRLPIEAISKANAKQRAGRAGRTMPGVCVRLYEEEDFQNRPEFLEPEILRTNLSAVILQMMKLNLGDIRQFPFIEKPPHQLIEEGYKELFELQAVSLDSRLRGNDRSLTPIGRAMSNLPLDPRLARMVIAGEKNHCLHEVLVIVSHLSVQDPREIPEEGAEKAKAMHRRYDHPESEFLSILNLWTMVHAETEGASTTQFRRYCEGHYLSFNRMREWQGVYAEVAAQLHLIPPASLGASKACKGGFNPLIHQSLLSGTLHFIGFYDDEKQCYRGAESKLFSIFPGSALAKKKFKWLMAESVMETTKTYARMIAKMDPAWLEPLARHLLKYQYAAPYYDVAMDEVRVFESALLYGMPVVSRRRVSFAKRDPVLSREIFIREGLVPVTIEGGKFLLENQATHAKLSGWEAKLRRLGIALSEEEWEAFYEKRLPNEIFNFRSLDSRLRGNDSAMIYDASERLTTLEARAGEYPDFLKINGSHLSLTYVFDFDSPQDGMTLSVPLLDLGGLPDDLPDQYPGMYFEIMDPDQKSLAVSQDLSALKAQFKMNATQVLQKTSLTSLPQGVFSSWNFGDLPTETEVVIQGKKTRVFPGLVESEDGKGLEISLFGTAEEAEDAQTQGVLFFLQKEWGKELKGLAQDPAVHKAMGELSFIDERKNLIDEFKLRVLVHFFEAENCALSTIYTEDAFKALVAMRGGWWNHQTRWIKWLLALAEETLKVRLALRSLSSKGLASSIKDLNDQFNRLLRKHFLMHADAQWLKRYPVYLKGMGLRMERLKNNPSREISIFSDLAPLLQKVQKANREDLEWQFEELRLNLFAQELKPTISISLQKMSGLLLQY